MEQEIVEENQGEMGLRAELYSEHKQLLDQMTQRLRTLAYLYHLHTHRALH